LALRQYICDFVVADKVVYQPPKRVWRPEAREKAPCIHWSNSSRKRQRTRSLCKWSRRLFVAALGSDAVEDQPGRTYPRRHRRGCVESAIPCAQGM